MLYYFVFILFLKKLQRRHVYIKETVNLNFNKVLKRPFYKKFFYNPSYCVAELCQFFL